MANTSAGNRVRWGTEQRLEFIEFRIYWEGGINRSEIIERFGVSTPQASNDLTRYRELAPGNLEYDASAKRYLAGKTFTPRFLDLGSGRYLAQLKALTEGTLDVDETQLGALPLAAAMPIPTRQVVPDILRGLLAATRNSASVEVSYQSMSPERPNVEWRRITPHAFGTDGLRWHIRSYCHIDHSFKDFILSRVRGLRGEGQPGAGPADDRDWNTTFDVELEPNPLLSEGQRAAVAWEHAMQKGHVTLRVRHALLYYLRRRLRLDVDYDSPAETPIIVANRVKFDQALASAKGDIVG